MNDLRSTIPVWNGSDGCYSVGRGGFRPQAIVIHTTDCTLAQAISRFQTATQEVSAHYIVGLDGSLTYVVDEANTAYHAGIFAPGDSVPGTTPGNPIANENSLGIEHVDNGNPMDSARTPEQYATSAALVARLCKTCGIPCDAGHVIPHHQVIATSCCDGLDVARIIRQAQAIPAAQSTEEEDDMWLSPLLRGTFDATGVSSLTQTGKDSQGNQSDERPMVTWVYLKNVDPEHRPFTGQLAWTPLAGGPPAEVAISAAWSAHFRAAAPIPFDGGFSVVPDANSQDVAYVLSTFRSAYAS